MYKGKFKVITGLGNKDKNKVKDLVLIWMKAGADIFDTSIEVMPYIQEEAKKAGFNLDDYIFCVSIPIEGDIHGKKAKIIKDKCNLCNLCKKVCVDNAINPPFVDELKCIGCSRCFDVCRNNAIKMYDDKIAFEKPFDKNIKLDMVEVHISIDDIDISLVEEISKLEPFGASNPSPAFVVNNLTLKEKKLMGSTKDHLKLIVETPNGTIDCVWWSRGDIPLISGDKIDIAFAPQLNTFNGVTSVQLILKDVHSDALKEEEASKIKVYDHRKKTNILRQVNDYIKNSKLAISVFAEDRGVKEALKPFEDITKHIVDRNHAQKANALMFFDYPADDEVMQNLMTTVAPDAVHYMNYQRGKYNEEAMLKTFSGMIKYTCSTLDGDFSLSRGAAALGVTEPVIETMLEMFEDTGMVKIKERAEDSFKIEFLAAVELSKTLHTAKYAEFVELLNTVNDYKNKFMTIDL